MSSSREFVSFVCDQLRDAGAVRYRMMFGEYCVYINEKPLLLVCDNNVLVKKLPELEPLLADAPVGVPYEGARERYILDVENVPLALEVIAVLDAVTPYKEKRSRKGSAPRRK